MSAQPALSFIRNNALGLLAVFIALGGTAIATQTVRTTKVVKVNEPSTLAKKKKVRGKPGPPGPQGPQGIQGLQGSSGLPGVVGRQGGGTGTPCTDDNSVGENCASITVGFEQAGRALLVSTANWQTTAFDDTTGPGSDLDSTTRTQGLCELTADGLSVPLTQVEVGEGQGGTDPTWTMGGPAGYFAPFAVTGVTDPLGPGNHTFALRCVEQDGNLDWNLVRISAVSLGAG